MKRVQAGAPAACSSARAKASRAERAGEPRAHSLPQRPIPLNSLSRGANCAPRAQRPMNAAPTLLQTPAVPASKFSLLTSNCIAQFEHCDMRPTSMTSTSTCEAYRLEQCADFVEKRRAFANLQQSMQIERGTCWPFTLRRLAGAGQRICRLALVAHAHFKTGHQSCELRISLLLQLLLLISLSRK